MKLISKNIKKYKGPVYDLAIQNTHSYNIEGLAVHNSVAGSMVAYLSKITNVNPIEYGLLFERFQNREKKSFPDIDTDFSNPSKVREYLKQKYGEERVASISNWSTLSPKVIIKDVARSLNMGGNSSAAFQIANEINGIMPDTDTLEEAIEESPKFAEYMKKYPELYEYAIKLQGLTRNLSVHAAGVVIGDRPLYEAIPLRIDEKTGTLITQWEKERCEENGLIKMDLLGLKTLNVIDECLDLIERNLNLKIKIEDVPLDDSETYKMISEGGTSGVFQLESSLTPLCKRIKPKNIEQISAINALGRPSCHPDVRETYINCALGLQPVDIAHPNLERALRPTNGILLYEESAMYIAQDCAGWDLNEADALRKISKLKGKDPELVSRTEAKFIKDCMAYSKIDYDGASYLWNEFLANLGSYSFNKCLSGETLIKVADIINNSPTTKMMRDLTKEDYVYYYDSQGFVGKTRVVELIFTGTKKLYELEFSDGSKIKSTLNHKFLNKNLRYLTVENIINNKSDLYLPNNVFDYDMKIISCNQVEEEDTFNLHVAAEEHNYILDNGLVSKNSHSISYSIVSYYTAWLRRHYPTQFMCSLLNSEDPNGDAAQEYLTSCKNMNIKIVPPNIKTSIWGYTVEKDGVIVTGFSAIKGIGDSAIKNIIEHKPYENISDFFIKTESRVVNKRVIESLIMAGAFDSFGFTRKGMFNNYDKFRIKIANKIKKIKKENQLTDDNFNKYNWLSQISNNLTFESEPEEWDRKELLLSEKNVLGHTISGPLHEIFGSFFKTDSALVTSLNQINDKAVKAKVKIEVIINNKIKEFIIKKGPRIGKKFAKYAIEDAYGNTSELTIWSEDYEKYREILTDGTPIKAICQITEYMGQKSLALSVLERRL